MHAHVPPQPLDTVWCSCCEANSWLGARQVADLKGCSSVLFFEARKKQDCYLWVAKTPSGPCAKFHVANGVESGSGVRIRSVRRHESNPSARCCMHDSRSGYSPALRLPSMHSAAARCILPLSDSSKCPPQGLSAVGFQAAYSMTREQSLRLHPSQPDLAPTPHHAIAGICRDDLHCSQTRRLCRAASAVHTMAELKLSGNHLKGSRPLLSFDKVRERPQLPLILALSFAALHTGIASVLGVARGAALAKVAKSAGRPSLCSSLHCDALHRCASTAARSHGRVTGSSALTAGCEAMNASAPSRTNHARSWADLA